LQCFDQPEAIEPRNHHVGEDEIGRIGKRCGERGLAVGEGLHLVSASEQALNILAHIGVVFNEQNAGLRRLNGVRGRGRFGRHPVRRWAGIFSNVQLLAHGASSEARNRRT
jgi:hypothetical protein